MYNFMLEQYGFKISPMLEHLILNPLKLQGVNNADLERIVKEYASIYQKRRIVLDGEKEWQQIAIFELVLFYKQTNKSELRKIFELP